MKKEKNLFSIGEIAKALGVTRRIILNYEQRGLIQPDIKEGTTGNRTIPSTASQSCAASASFRIWGFLWMKSAHISTIPPIFCR